jgi:hypothetical protein
MDVTPFTKESTCSSNGEHDESTCCISKVNWGAADSLSMEWYDGHVPESLASTAIPQRSATAEQPKQYMRIYPKYHGIPSCYTNSDRSDSDKRVSSNHESSNKNDGMFPSSPFVYCIDDAVPIEITNAIYHYTTQTNLPQKTWGTYITMKQIQTYWNSSTPGVTDCKKNTDAIDANHDCVHLDSSSGTPSQEGKIMHLDSIAVSAAAHFVKNYVSAHTNVVEQECCGKYPNLFRGNIGATKNSIPMDDTNIRTGISSCSNHHDRHLDGRTGTIYDEAHGIAIWALASEIGSEVPYHIDYAELLRYETGIIVPPIIAGTWHCTPNHNQTHFRGGEYCVVARENGLDHYYKHGYKGKLKPALETNMIDHQESNNDILRLEYKFNRMICQSGHLPHWSTRVEAPSSAGDTLTEENVRRVIVGFNVFLHDVGPAIQQAPEHSEAFRKRVSDRKRQNKNLSLQALTSNPQLSRLLVLAKRQKNLQTFREAQNDLNEQIQRYILSKNNRVTVEQLLVAFTPPERTNQWPFDANDVQVHIHNACKKGTLRTIGADNCEEQRTKLIGKDVYIECYSKKENVTVRNAS